MKGNLEGAPCHLEAEFEEEFVGDTHGDRAAEIIVVKPASSWSNGSIGIATKIETVITSRGSEKEKNSQHPK